MPFRLHYWEDATPRKALPARSDPTRLFMDFADADVLRAWAKGRKWQPDRSLAVQRLSDAGAPVTVTTVASVLAWNPAAEPLPQAMLDAAAPRYLQIEAAGLLVSFVALLGDIQDRGLLRQPTAAALTEALRTAMHEALALEREAVREERARKG